ncbi:MAG: ATP-binding protein [Mycoplasmataceae bacterium]|nr:ATP-binding protein [Mycoplasmataceae bacterium]
MNQNKFKEVIRKQYLKKIEQYVGVPIIKVLTGIRKSGKSTVLKQIQEHLLKTNTNVITIDMNKEENKIRFSSSIKLTNYLKTKVNTTNRFHIFIDEIQEIPNWEKSINELTTIEWQNLDFYITGSNSKLLSRELATLLTAKYIQFEVFPFSFQEYKELCELNNLSYSYQDYFLYGGMPLSIQFPTTEGKIQYLQSIYSSVLENDILQRKVFKNIRELKNIYLFIINNIGKQISFDNIAQYLKSVNNQQYSASTISLYVEWLDKTYLIRECKYWQIKTKEIMTNNTKYYLIDNGFFIANDGKIDNNSGYLLENIVFNQFKRQGYDVYAGTDRYIDVDFVLTLKNQITYVQVCFELDANNYKREFENLLKIKDNNRKIIICEKNKTLNVNNGIEIILIEAFLKNP